MSITLLLGLYSEIQKIPREKQDTTPLGTHPRHGIKGVSTSTPGSAARTSRVAQGELGMAKVKQVARSSIGGRAPRTKLAEGAANVCRGSLLNTNRTYLDLIIVVGIRADTRKIRGY